VNAHREIPTFLDPPSARIARRILPVDGGEGKQPGLLQSDVGTLNQLVHLWKFDDDADRRLHWKAVFANTDFMAFAVKLRPSIMTQEVKLLLAAPWGPHP
jgi:hypothetical protein